MRTGIALLCFSLIFSTAPAADPAPSALDTYISARDRAASQLCAKPDAELSKAYPRVLADLADRLAAFVPPWRAPGFPAKGQYTVASLCKGDIDVGMLDGFAYRSGDTAVTLTNRALLRRWLADHRKWWGSHDVPPAIPAAFRSDAFYTQAVSTDAAANLYGMVLVKAPPGADLAMVHLNVFAQDFVMDGGPDSLLAVVVRGDRVFVAQQKLAAAATPVPYCRKTMQQVLARAKAGPATGSRDLRDGPEGLADRDYRACFAQHLREQKNYAAIQKQAQALVDLLH